MQLSRITQFLEIYKKKLALEDDKRGMLIQIIFDETGVKLDEKFLDITKGTIKIKSSHVVKNEIFFHKARILQKIKEGGRTDIFDIQ